MLGINLVDLEMGLNDSIHDLGGERGSLTIKELPFPNSLSTLIPP